MKKVILVDNHPLILEGMRTLIRKDNRFDLLGEAPNAKEAYRLLEKKTPDLMVVDISMPGESGIDLTKRVKFLYPDVKILIISFLTDEETVAEAFRAGCDGYLSKDAAVDTLLEALDTIAHNKVFIDSLIAPALVSVLKNVSRTKIKTDDRHPPLTDSERELLRFLAEGLTTKQIAERRFVSEKAVEQQRLHLYKKLNIHTLAEAIQISYQLFNHS